MGSILKAGVSFNYGKARFEVVDVDGNRIEKVLVEAGPGMGNWISNLVFEIFLAVLASIVVLCFSGKREYRADAGNLRLQSCNLQAESYRLPVSCSPSRERATRCPDRPPVLEVLSG